MLSGSFREFSHADICLSKYYYALWGEGLYIRRRVYTNKFLDRSVMRQQATIDIDWGHVRDTWDSHITSRNRWTDSRKNKETQDKKNYLKQLLCGRHPQKKKLQQLAQEDNNYNELRNIIPLLRIKKGVLYDTSVRDSGGAALHLSRRSVNRRVSAYMILGFCLKEGLDKNVAEDVFNAALLYLEDSAERNSHLIIKEALGGGLNDQESLKKLEALLRRLKNHYIQCVEVERPNTGLGVIKFITENSLLEEHQIEPKLESLQTPLLTQGSSEVESSNSTNTQKLLKQSRAKRRFFSSEGLGFRSTRFIIDAPELSGEEAPVHLRIVAPEGTMIDDAEILPQLNSRQQESLEYKPFFPSQKEGHVSFRHQRAIVLDRNFPPNSYSFLIKLNPKRSLFLIPAICILGIQAVILGFVLLAGPERIQRHDSAIMSALFFIFPLLTILVAREGEHEIMSRLLERGRGFVVASGMLQVTCGIFIATLPPIKNPPDPPGIHQLVTIGSAILNLLWSSLVLYLLCFQCIRISAMRRVTNIRRSKLAETGSIDEAREAERRSYRKFLMKVTLITLVIVIIFVITVIVVVWPHISRAWLLSV